MTKFTVFGIKLFRLFCGILTFIFGLSVWFGNVLKLFSLRDAFLVGGICMLVGFADIITSWIG